MKNRLLNQDLVQMILGLTLISGNAFGGAAGIMIGNTAEELLGHAQEQVKGYVRALTEEYSVLKTRIEKNASLHHRDELKDLHDEFEGLLRDLQDVDYLLASSVYSAIDKINNFRSKVRSAETKVLQNLE